MNRQQKIDKYNEIYNFFTDARNHGNNGNNWWYPKQNVIAYNVKLYGGLWLESIRTELTDRQNDYYSDELLYDIIQERQNREAIILSDMVDDMDDVLSSGFAGRSGGWLEVEFQNYLEYIDEDFDNYTDKEITELYNDAQDLMNNQVKVEEFISTAKSNYEQYLKTPEAVSDLVEELLTDDEIGEIYKGRVKDILDKLK